jgi:hypothetical protein
VIRAAQAAELNLVNPPDTYRADGLAVDVLQPMLDHAQTVLSKYYAGGLLTRKISEKQGAIRTMLSARAGGSVGGVSALDLKDVQSSGGTARVKARVTIWFKTAPFWWQDPKTDPSASNVIDLDLHLIRDASVWKIDRESWQFAPGGGP